MWGCDWTTFLSMKPYKIHYFKCCFGRHSWFGPLPYRSSVQFGLIFYPWKPRRIIPFVYEYRDFQQAEALHEEDKAKVIKDAGFRINT